MSQGILGYLADEVGYPFNQIPTKMGWAYRGGIYSWGSICGALPPAIDLIGLVTDLDTGQKLINELMAWYKDFPFPAYPGDGTPLPTTVADSSLCHVSVTKWMQVANVPREDKTRSERCGRLTADVTKFTVEMLNSLSDNKFEAKHKPSAVVGECMACHSKLSYAHGKETCTACHGDPHK